jgi:hypothetical protein
MAVDGEASASKSAAFAGMGSAYFGKQDVS